MRASLIERFKSLSITYKRFAIFHTNCYNFTWPSVAALVLFSFQGYSQDVAAVSGSFGVDEKHHIIVWHNDAIDTLLSRENGSKQLKFDKEYTLINPPVNFNHNTEYALSAGSEKYALYLTTLPIVHITIDTLQINARRKIAGNFSYFNKGTSVKHGMGIRYRGNLSLTFPKKSYDIEFWADSTGKQTKDFKFDGLRKDDDWILDGLYNEPLRLRSYVAVQLWKTMHKPYYLSREPKAKSGFDFKFVEVFKNKEYIGLYALSESVDRKQLELQKQSNGKIRGELFKAESYESATQFKEAAPYNNVFPNWSGFRMEYPFIDFRAHWNDLAELVRLVATAPEKDFVESIEGQINIKNVIDYYLFVNLLRATDNLGKNYYIGRYDEKEPYFFIPWDLDGVLGTIQDGKRIATNNDLLSNNLFDRLLSANPKGFKNIMKERWSELRKGAFSDASLHELIDMRYRLFITSKVYDRESLVWPSNLIVKNHHDYIKTWLTGRLQFLDTHFTNL